MMPLTSQQHFIFRSLSYSRAFRRRLHKNVRNFQLHQIYVLPTARSKNIIENGFTKRANIILITQGYKDWKNREHHIPRHNENLLIGVLKIIPALIVLALLKIQHAYCEDAGSSSRDKSPNSENSVPKHSLSERPESSEYKSNNNIKENVKVDKNSKVIINSKLDSGSDVAKHPSNEKGQNNGTPQSNNNVENKEASKKDSKNNVTSNPKKPESLPRLPIPHESNKVSALTLRNAIDLSKMYINRKLGEVGAPGISVVVSINGKNVWADGIGLSDVENGVPMTHYTVMRIASISKSLTMVAVAQLMEEGKLDLDAPIQKYVPDFPKKFVDGEEVTITTRHLLNHTSGIRHYKLKSEIDSNKKQEKSSKKEETPQENSFESKDKSLLNTESKRQKLKELLAEKAVNIKQDKSEKDEEFCLLEYYIKEEFETISESLKLFQDDELLFKPGERYHYSTHAWTLVSAVVEGASGKPYTKVMTKLFRSLCLQNTFLDKNDPIIYRRARFYIRDEHGRLKNAPYVDNSYKWAGGGFLSNVIDLARFGNAMLYSFQNTQNKSPQGFLKASTMKQMWTRCPNTKLGWDVDGGYGLGWGIVEEEKEPKAFVHNRRFYASHTGGAIGASSVLLIMPTGPAEGGGGGQWKGLPQGVVVALITNMQNTGLNQLANTIADLFARVHNEAKVVGSIQGNEKHKLYNLHES